VSRAIDTTHTINNNITIAALTLVPT